MKPRVAEPGVVDLTEEEVCLSAMTTDGPMVMVAQDLESSCTNECSCTVTGCLAYVKLVLVLSKPPY